MRYEVGTSVDVYDPDERRWYAGTVYEIKAITSMPEKFYIVKLDEKQTLTAKSFTKSMTDRTREDLDQDTLPELALLAVPVSHDGWIRPRS